MGGFNTDRLFGSSLPPHCTPINERLVFVSELLGTCIPTPLAFVSTVLGGLSILSWLFAQLPQIFKNYKVGSTSGLSFFFLVEWCAGDISNLLGAWLTRQATWQVIVASYYVSVDLVLVCQHTWYTHLKPRRRQWKKWLGLSEDSEEELDEDADSFEDDMSIEQASFRDSESDEDRQPAMAEQATRRSRGETPGRVSVMPGSTTLLVISMLCALASAHPHTLRKAPELDDGLDRAEFIGQILSWMSTVFYLGSRLPQLYKNHVRGSTAGLSPTLFLAAFCGNFFYSSSLLTNPSGWYDFAPYGGHGWAGPEGSSKEEWTALATPFFLGAAGVLLLDAAVGLQFIMLNKGEVDREDREGHWGRRRRQVTGWMRGWLPNSTTPPVSEDETEPLSGSRQLARRSSRRRGHRSSTYGTT